MTTEHSQTINGARAAILYTALETALIVTRQRLTLKGAEPYRDAIDMQISAYEGEKAELVRLFPELNRAAKS
jgi:hypothetical protein